MTGSNLPPGVSENDIPGNRPEDVADEHFWTAFEHKLVEENIEVPDGENDPFDAWNADWFVRAVDMARNMGYNLGYTQGEGDTSTFDAYMDMEVDDKLQDAVRELGDKIHSIITELRKKHADEA